MGSPVLRLGLELEVRFFEGGWLGVVGTADRHRPQEPHGQGGVLPPDAEGGAKPRRVGRVAVFNHFDEVQVVTIADGDIGFFLSTPIICYA